MSANPFAASGKNRRERRTGRGLAMAMAVLAGCTICNVAHAGDPPSIAIGPAGIDFYNPPEAPKDARHGDLIWVREITSGAPGSTAWKLLYWSTTADNQLVPVSALAVVPDSPAPPHGRPIVSWAHGTSGVPRNCAPSMVDNPARDATFYFMPNSPASYDFGIPGLTGMIAAGYVVVATDYNGLGAPGIHHYLIGPTEARNVLDASVAVRHLRQAGAGENVVAIGWSQGGQAAIWSGQMADYVAGSAKLVGAVALAPVNALEQTKVFDSVIASGKKLPPMSFAERAMAWYAMTIAYPELKFSDVMTPVGEAVFAEAAKAGQCNHHMGDTFAYAQGYRGAMGRPDPANQDAWLARIKENALGFLAAQVPVAVYQGKEDVAVAPAATEAYVKLACAMGAVISFTEYDGVDHIRLSAKATPEFLSWIAQRFAGKPAARTCE
ncbi:lipase family protein [uncultured Rhodoblastus sp.]|uniref:lipase family protein n=1 Tax=uncultured Rhodoblastus sp. TaxID=543037 RepID=UPI0025EECFBE|nr:lipase family protein [uncultured Rhodoblastus sp.]